MTAEPRTEIERYRPDEIEPRWRERWDRDHLYRTPDRVDGKQNRYHLTMFPYTSGDLHAGHWWAIAPSDTYARFYRMRGFNVLFPMGFDAFGLPAENAAIKGGAHPKDWTDANVERMRGQLKTIGTMFDWEREVNSSSPEYYRWTQWWFAQFFKHDLAYRKRAAANFCPSCNTTLANEQVVDGRCERCETQVEQRDMEQWFFRITRYAEELLANEALEWPDHVKLMQRNWIGRSEGAEAAFRLDPPAPDGTAEIRVFTTRPDTLHGVTFMVLAPEHPLVDALTTPAQRAAVDAYVEQARRATEIERQSTERDKTGVFTGAYCVNYLTNERVPIWIADYVLATYGTGAVMAVPAHDQRDFEFAQKFGLPIKIVVSPPDWDGATLTEAYLGSGPLVNSGSFDAEPSEQAKGLITEQLAASDRGGPRIQYRLRDWLISRQRYWGAPIPIVYCDECGPVVVPDDQLPVELPYDVEFLPTGQSPLALSEAFVNTTCPECGRPARRETDTLDTFMCSSWYFMRYPDAHNPEAAIGSAPAANWLPVDQYTGGSEHAVMHLLYARFFYKVARDLGIVPGDEPFTRYFSQGQVLGPDGRRMSKSRGNVVAPDDQVSHWGADTFRAYLMFLGPWDQGGPYDVDGIVGVSRWLHRVWNVVIDPPTLVSRPDGDEARELRRLVHETGLRVTRDLDHFAFNTMIAAMMELTNHLQRVRDSGEADAETWHDAIERLVLMLAPSCPHLAEELWARIGRPYAVHTQAWPEFDEALARRDTIRIAVQVNGKVRGHIELAAAADEATARAAAEADDRIREHMEGKQVRRVIYVPGRLLNIVVG
ncbi:MAG: leucine--tRNA ligase [Chloroflexi bacterium]|nr:leucine--tRNA ligase [Chloroflexota bacterium]MDA1003096.1 leucine--tRNA ligase [Chloroflexota bacterium]MQC27718.1 leucine--tRNA ligase [Chloroflexota bacterium]